jgi:hypothetical protein
MHSRMLCFAALVGEPGEPMQQHATLLCHTPCCRHTTATCSPATPCWPLAAAAVRRSVSSWCLVSRRLMSWRRASLSWQARRATAAAHGGEGTWASLGERQRLTTLLHMWCTPLTAASSVACTCGAAAGYAQAAGSAGYHQILSSRRRFKHSCNSSSTVPDSHRNGSSSMPRASFAAPCAASLLLLQSRPDAACV